MPDKVLIEKFKGYEIFFDKEFEKFVADKEALGIHFESRALWEIKGLIGESTIKEINKEYYLVEGVFDDKMYLVNILTYKPYRKECDSSPATSGLQAGVRGWQEAL